MRIVMFYHSLVSDWDHGNAHFLRGIATELIARGHDVRIFEPADAWSAKNLIRDHGTASLDEFRRSYPGLSSERYVPSELDIGLALEGADLVLVHEWNDPGLVREIGKRRTSSCGFRLLFHDTHHRMVTRPEEMSGFDLSHYDGALCFGKVIAELYQSRGHAARAWTWHEAADTRVFKPLAKASEPDGDLIWIGNWADDERTEELREFLIEPSSALGLKTRIHGVRYPREARAELEEAGIEYRGWLPNYRAPEVFSRHLFTVHVPRRPYASALPGIPTIRVFEALACGIPLLSAPWDDIESLFTPGEDFWFARNGAEMRTLMKIIVHDPEQAAALAARGRETVLKRHTCAHRVNELLSIHEQLSHAAPINAARAARSPSTQPASRSPAP